MRFLHLSDLHIGKIVNGFSMRREQEYILKQVVEVAKEVRPDGILLAGDIYDKSMPSAEAVECFDCFLSQLEEEQIAVFMISGNHDSPERIDYFSRILQKRNIYIAGDARKELFSVSLEDAYGVVQVYLLPFLKPAYIRGEFPEHTLESYEDAVRAVIEHTKLDTSKRNILVAHQFFISEEKEPERCDSEQIAVGGLDSISSSLLKDFDYVALGHLHREQSIGSEKIRYAGSPLKYSFSEVNHQKGMLQIDFKEKGNTVITKIPLQPRLEMREIKGTIEELLEEEFYTKQNCEDYLHITLTDEDYVQDPLGQLRCVYKNIMCLDYDNARTRAVGMEKGESKELSKNPIELFGEFYQQQNGIELSEERLALVENVFSKIGGDL